MGSIFLDLNLSLKPSYVPQTIANLLKDLSEVDNFSDRLMLLNGYLQKQQEELSQVEAFKHQIPHCMLLLLDAIEILKEEVTNIRNVARSESRERSLMEFLSLKRASYESMKRKLSTFNCMVENNQFMSSSSNKLYELNHGGHGKILAPLHLCTIESCAYPRGANPILASKLVSIIKNLKRNSESSYRQELAKSFHNGNLSKRVNDKPLENTQSKPTSELIVKSDRMCWTPKLHSKFMQVVEELGGPEVVRPRHIQEKMKELTVDQIKSHLQKYRLNIKRRRFLAAKKINHFPLVYKEKFQEPCSRTSNFYHSQIQHLRRDPQVLLGLHNSK